MHRRALRAVTIWLAVLALFGLGMVLFREPPDQHFGVREYLINVLAGCLAFAGGWSAFDLWRSRRSGRATGLLALGSGLLLFGADTVQGLQSAAAISWQWMMPALAAILCAVAMLVLGNRTVVSDLRADPGGSWPRHHGAA